MAKMMLFLLVFCVSVFASAFSEGWTEGYKAGACYRIFACIPPIPPIPPLPRIGENTYMDGYKCGFLAGLTAKNRG